MLLKKGNAVLSLLTFVAMLTHIGYTVYAYLTFYYNPVLTKAFAIPLIVLTCLHAVLGMCAVFLLSDGTKADLYAGKNRRTIIQRITAALIFPLLILHINTFKLLQAAASAGQPVFFWLLILSQVLFYGVFILHAAVSFGRALITLGLVSSRKALKVIDGVVAVLCAAVFVIAAFAVIRTQIAMLLLG